MVQLELEVTSKHPRRGPAKGALLPRVRVRGPLPDVVRVDVAALARQLLEAPTVLVVHVSIRAVQLRRHLGGAKRARVSGRERDARSDRAAKVTPPPGRARELPVTLSKGGCVSRDTSVIASPLKE